MQSTIEAAMVLAVLESKVRTDAAEFTDMRLAGLSGEV